MLLVRIGHAPGAEPGSGCGRHLVQDAEGMGTVAVPGSFPDGCDKAGHGRLDLVSDGLES